MLCYVEKLAMTSCLQVRLSPRRRLLPLSQKLQGLVKFTVTTGKKRTKCGGTCLQSHQKVVETGRLGIQDQLRLNNELEASLNYMRLHLKTIGKTTTKNMGRREESSYLSGPPG